MDGRRDTTAEQAEAKGKDRIDAETVYGIWSCLPVEGWILYALIIVIAILSLRCFMNGVRIFEAELRETRNVVRELDGPEVLRELKAIKYIVEGLESDYNGFVLKEKVGIAGHQE